MQPGPLPGHSEASWEVAVCSNQVKLPEGVVEGQLSIWTNLKQKKCVRFHKDESKEKDPAGLIR